MTNPNPNDAGLMILGWKVDANLEPTYWLNPIAKPGFHSPDDLFMIHSKSMEAHTVIIAQSGSGKSFFLGRVIEELLLSSKARALILDPNSDFRRMNEVQSASLWTNAGYDHAKRKAKLPHEKSREEFSDQWSEIPMRVRTGPKAGPPYETLQIRWLSLSMDFLAEDVMNPMLRSDLYNCHAFVKELGELLRYKFKARQIVTDLIDEAQWVFKTIKDSLSTDSAVLDESKLRASLESRYGVEQILGLQTADSTKSDKVVIADGAGISRAVVENLSELFIKHALTISQYVDKGIQRFYFGKAREYQVAGILKTQTAEPPWHERPPVRRLEVVDLPSLPDRSTRLLAINAVLTTEWERARASWNAALEREADDDVRTPTFIVIDEAHNLIPRKTRNKAESSIREQFRTLSAEGRKYGLFLILVSQRPDKLDTLVLSECQNKAVMKLGSRGVLKTTKMMLGLDELDNVQAALLDRCLEFDTGRFLLAGQWSPKNPQVAFCAARRTTEGGRNLRESYWATPFREETKK
jgi:hypothetical protein